MGLVRVRLHRAIPVALLAFPVIWKAAALIIDTIALMQLVSFFSAYLMKILYAVTGWLWTFLGGAQDKLTVLESALNTIGLLGGGSGTSGKSKAEKRDQVILFLPDLLDWKTFATAQRHRSFFFWN